MEYEKKEFLVYRQGRTITDQFYIDDDYNVPDAKHDVKRVILGEGSLLIDDIKRVENYVRVSGKMNFKVLYATDEGEMRLAFLEGRIPFEEMVYAEEEPEENLFIKTMDCDVNVTMIHSRKLNIKALVEFSLCSEGRQEQHLTMDASGDGGLYKKYAKKDILKLFAVKKDTYRIKEEITIGGTKETVGVLLWTAVSPRKLDTRIVQDELILQGELLLFCFYESLEGKTDWFEQTIPYEGRMEINGAQEGMFHQVYPSVTDVSIDVRMDEDGEMRLLGIEATLEARIIVYEEETVELLEDVYSLDKVCRPKIADKALERSLMQNHSKCKIAERLLLPEIKDDILQICHSNARIQLEHTEAVPEGIKIEGVLHVFFLYVKADDDIPFDVWQGMVPFSYLLESNETTEDMQFDLVSAVEQLSIGLLGNGEIEVKAVLAFNCFVKQPVPVADIEEIDEEPINLEELEKRPGIIGYIVKEGDELWNLAKHYSTTVDGIMEINEKTNSDIKPGEKLLIFKENMSIL
ncbi:MAG: DUF3794 domain-containing protein [Dorea sp.]|nr:DUF3794 domain-containing protein [Dorea sp.]